MNKIILASNNAHKIKEIKEILSDFHFEVISLLEAGINVEIDEDGKTFEENAFKKAKEIMDLTGQACLADDSGLEVYALNGAPGVYSARFSGEHGNSRKNNDKLLELMKEVPDNKRGARFVSSIVLLFPDGREIKVEGYVEGIIGYEEKGAEGFGYDPLFFIPELQKTFAQLGSREKNAISHRGEALKLLKMKLELL
jgi:XTP/dITP diphosphohydrolase